MESNIGEIIRNSLDSIREIADANTIIGEPISTPNGTTIIPVSKVSLGIASGGVDFKNEKNGQNAPAAQNGKKERPKSFGGGGGTGLSISPVAFLVISADGSVEMLNINNVDTRPNNIVESLTDMVERAPEIISKIKSVVGSKKSDESEDILGDDESTDVTEA
ncbi:MAG: sporulation protein YtfJ [Clostridia bacterium]|jgi:sporulation protein YtfJ|nr:sporulation protein YtfJ [Clostridia bacterium]